MMGCRPVRWPDMARYSMITEHSVPRWADGRIHAVDLRESPARFRWGEGERGGALNLMGDARVY
jgi:hypothetical protein